MLLITLKTQLPCQPHTEDRRLQWRRAVRYPNPTVQLSDARAREQGGTLALRGLRLEPSYLDLTLVIPVQPIFLSAQSYREDHHRCMVIVDVARRRELERYA